MKIVQLGACKGNDHVTELVKSRNDVEFLLLVEPNPKVYQSLKECYDFFPNTIIEKLAIVPDYTRGKDVEMFFSEADSTGGYQVTSLYKNHVIRHYAYQQDSIESFFVKSITLEDLFQKHNILELDYLFVDIEGMDEDVILNLDLKKYKIKNICVEYIHLKNPDKLYSFLNKHGYREQNGIFNMYDKMFSKDVNKVNRTIYNILPFYNELDLLEFRLEESYDYVDKFVIIESHQTHSGNSKELYFQNNADRYQKYKDKIIHLVCDYNSELFLEYNNSQRSRFFSDYFNQENWIRETFQRDYATISKVIPFEEEDILMVTDADEIVNVESVEYFINTNLVVDRPYRLEMYMTHYFINAMLYNNDDTYLSWKFPYLIRYKDLEKYNNSLSYCRTELWSDIEIIKNGGWHLSYLFDAKGILNKLQNFAHANDDTIKFLSLNDVEKSLLNLTIVYDSSETYKIRECSLDLLPNTIKNNLKKWNKYLIPKPKSLAILGSYPNTDMGLKVLKESIESLKDHFDILLSTHYPVNQEIQKMVKYYVYDHRNEKLKNEYDTYTWWWGSPELYVQTESSDKKENHHYACYRLITNGIELLKDYYEDFYYIEGDCIFHSDDIVKLKKMKEDSISNAKKACFFTFGDNFFTTLAFWSKMDFYIETIPVLKTSQEFNECTDGKNSLEKFYPQEIKGKNKLEDVHMLYDISPITYFDKSKIAQLIYVPSGYTISANYRIVLVRQTSSFLERKLDSNNIYFVFYGRGHYQVPLQEEEEIDIKIDGVPLVLKTGNYCYWQQIQPTSDKITIQHNGVIDEYNVAEILSDKNSFIIFNKAT